MENNLLLELCMYARNNDVSDIHLTTGDYPAFRRYGKLERCEDFEIISDTMMEEITDYALLSCDIPAELKRTEDVDFCFVDNDKNRYRSNIYTKQGHYSMVLRLLNEHIPSMTDLKLPEVFYKIAKNKNGLILVTGPTGSGKTTSLAAILDYINGTDAVHILTFEDPIEYVYDKKLAVISQREVGKDTPSFASALKSALREDPDIILVGEMRDAETIGAALTAAETGHLVLSTLHTMGAAKTIDRIIDVFPTNQQPQVRTQLATTLRAVVSQILLPRANGHGRVAAFEILISDDAVSAYIKQNKTGQLNSSIEMGQNQGMISMPKSLHNLLDSGVITEEIAKPYLMRCED